MSRSVLVVITNDAKHVKTLIQATLKNCKVQGQVECQFLQHIPIPSRNLTKLLYIIQLCNSHSKYFMDSNSIGITRQWVRYYSNKISLWMLLI